MKIVMLVRNDGVHDTRVRKEATFLQACGHNVVVLALWNDKYPEDEFVNGVRYSRIAYKPLTVARAKNRHLKRIEKVKDQRDRVVERFRRREPRILRRVLSRNAFRKLTETTRLLFRGRIIASRYRFHVIRFLYHRLKFFHLSYSDYQKVIEHPLRELCPEVVHAHDLNTAYAAWRYHKTTGTPFVYDAHEFELGRNDLKTGTLRKLAKYRLERKVIRAAAATITVSAGIAQTLAKIYRVRLPIVVQNSPAIETLRLAPSLSLRHHLGLGKEHKLVVYVGYTTHGRGLEQLVGCLGHLPSDYHVVLLGPRSEAIATDIQALAEAAAVADRLHMVDPVPPQEIPATIRDADVCVIPIQNVCKSYDLALPNKLFDAIFAGLPIAVGRLREMEAFVKTNRLGVVFDEKDPASIAKSLREVVGKPRPSQESLAKLQKEVCWERQSERLEKIYSHIAGPGT